MNTPFWAGFFAWRAGLAHSPARVSMGLIRPPEDQQPEIILISPPCTLLARNSKGEKNG